MSALRKRDFTYGQLLQLQEQHGSWLEAARAIGSNPNSLRGRKSKLKAAEARALPAVEPKRRTDEVIAAGPWHLRLVEPEPVFKDDSDEIAEAIAKVAAENRPILSHIKSDQHFGDESKSAIAMHIEITRASQPDFNIDAGDVFDFSTLSTFSQPAKIVTESALRAVKPLYRQYIEAIHEAAPRAVNINFTGNHDRRANAKANEIWMFNDEIVEAYATLVRCNGLVLWSGWLENFYLFSLNIRHGERTNKNAAESTAVNDLGLGMHVTMGHTHRFSMMVKAQTIGKNFRRYITALNLGYAGSLDPHYITTDTTNWVHGSILAHVYPSTLGVVNLQPIIYHPTPTGGLVAFLGTKRIEVDIEGRRVA